MSGGLTNRDSGGSFHAAWLAASLYTQIACWRFRIIFLPKKSVMGITWHLISSLHTIIDCRILLFFTEHTLYKEEHWTLEKHNTNFSANLLCIFDIMLSNKSLKPCVLSVLFTVKSKTLYKDIIRARSRIN